MIPKFYYKLSVTSYRTHQGFTLSELLIVISVIAIITASLSVSLSQSLRRSRDHRRISDIQAVRSALELYYQDHDRYPGPSENISVAGQYIGCTASIDDILAEYMIPVPKDPMHNCGDADPTYFYAYDPQHLQSNDSGCYRGSHRLNEESCDCGTGGSVSAVVFGFNRAETMTKNDLNKDTCAGNNRNLDNADYNVAIRPMPL